MLTQLKRSAYAVSERTGFSTRVGQSSWRRERVLILCYHGVALRDEHEWDPNLFVSRATFERRMALIESHRCHVLRLDDAIERLYAGTLPERAVVLTFDDGFHDFATGAYPVLQRYGFPATVYLTTQRCEHNYPIVRLFVSYMLWKHAHRVLDGRDLPGLAPEQYPLATPEQRNRVLRQLEGPINSSGPTAKDAIALEVARRLDVDYDAWCAERLLSLMNPNEVAALAAAGVDFQLHTHRHRTPEDPKILMDEIFANGERIERMTGTRPTHFCYPSGTYRSAYLPYLRAAGIKSATTCEAGLADASMERLLLPRFVENGRGSDEEFQAWLTGPASWLPRRRWAVAQ
jgi:peptidoglycan/xylan/chitin deacetylase (PgdA/CDA1 family)